MREPFDYDQRPLEGPPDASPVQIPARKRLELAGVLESVVQMLEGNR